MMGSGRQVFDDGVRASRLTSRRQAILRGTIQGVILGIAIFGPFSIWVRVPVCLVAFLVVGAVASSPQRRGKL